MNTFWLKVAGAGVLAVVVLIVAGQFTGGDKKEAAQEEPVGSGAANVYEQDERDHERLNAPIQVATPETPPAQAEATTDPSPLPEFAKLTMEQQVAAERLWEMTETEFKIGRKPMMSFGNCVKHARQIIEQFANLVCTPHVWPLVLRNAEPHSGKDVLNQNLFTLSPQAGEYQFVEYFRGDFTNFRDFICFWQGSPQ